MTELICDICGTSYPDTASKCPTCGYSRAFDALTYGAGADHAEHEKVRGGRFSRRNVLRRLNKKVEAEEQAEPQAEEAPAEIPVEEPVQPEPDEAVTRAYRRDVGLNIALFAALAAFLLAGGYLLVNYGLPYLQTLIG